MSEKGGDGVSLEILLWGLLIFMIGFLLGFTTYVATRFLDRNTKLEERDRHGRHESDPI